MQVMVSSAENLLIATRLRQSITRAGSTGQEGGRSGLILTVHASLIRWQMMAIHYRTRMKKSGSSGSSTQKGAGPSELKWVNSSAHQRCITYGYRTDRKTHPSTGMVCAGHSENRSMRYLQ